MIQIVCRFIHGSLRRLHLDHLVPDKIFLKILYGCVFNKRLNLKNPQTFQEKLQYLKLYNRNALYTTLVDKYSAKEYVNRIIGSEYIIPTLGVWNNFDEIDFSKLPRQFVLKCTHDSGNVVVCQNKLLFDSEEAKKTLTKALSHNIYWPFREWPYKDVKPRIIAEQYLEDTHFNELRDYKFSCFDGKVTDVMVCLDRNTEDTKYYFFDENWKLLRYNKRGLEAQDNFTIDPPLNYKEMFTIASKLSKGLPYVRVDLYNVNGHIFFGELTFFPCGGMDSNILPEVDIMWGNFLKLP
jgi:hypothetical protein